MSDFDISLVTSWLKRRAPWVVGVVAVFVVLGIVLDPISKAVDIFGGKSDAPPTVIVTQSNSPGAVQQNAGRDIINNGAIKPDPFGPWTILNSGKTAAIATFFPPSSVPSRAGYIQVLNPGSLARHVVFELKTTQTGTLLGTYTTKPIGPGASPIFSAKDIEFSAGATAPTNGEYLNLRITASEEVHLRCLVGLPGDKWDNCSLTIVSLPAGD